MGIAGAALVTRWSLSLIRASSHVLLDMEALAEIRHAVRESLEKDTDPRVSDLHIWAVGAAICAAAAALVASAPRSPDYYADLVPAHLPLVHVTVEVHRCDSHEPSPGTAPVLSWTGK